MFKISEESIQDLTTMHNLIDHLEVKGINNSNILSNIASLIQKVYSSIDQSEKIDDGIKIEKEK